MKTFHWSTLVAFGLQLLGFAFGLGMLVVVIAGVARGGEADTLPRRPCDAQAAAMQPPAPKTTGVPELDDLLREAKRRNATVAQPFQEDGVGRTWFQATPDGWLSRVPPPVQAKYKSDADFTRPLYVPPPRPEVAVAAPARTFRIPLTRMECEYDASHVCSKCGTVQLVIAKWNADGTHSHQCPNAACRHTWRH